MNVRVGVGAGAAAAGGGAADAGVGGIDPGVTGDVKLVPLARSTSLGGTVLPAKNSAAVSAGSVESAGG